MFTLYRIPGGNNKTRVRPVAEPVPRDQRGEAVPVPDVLPAGEPSAAVRVHWTDAGEGCV